jgi:hypothetical protein
MKTELNKKMLKMAQLKDKLSSLTEEQAYLKKEKKEQKGRIRESQKLVNQYADVKK